MKPIFDLGVNLNQTTTNRFGFGQVRVQHRGLYLGKPVPIRLEDSGATGFSKATRAVFHASQRPLGHVGSWAVQAVGIASMVVFGSAFAVIGAGIGLARRHGRFSGLMTAKQRMAVGGAAGFALALVPSVIVALPVAAAQTVATGAVAVAATVVASPGALVYAAASRNGRGHRPQHGRVLVG